MNKRFNPLSAAVAVATAGVMVTVAGCAMGTHADRTSADSSNTSTTPLAMTGQSTETPGQAMNQPATTVQTAQAMPSTPWKDPNATGLQGRTQGDTSATPAPTVTQPAATGSYPGAAPATADYSRSNNPPSNNPPNNGMSGSASTNSGSMNTATRMDTAGSDNNTQPLPPRTDRN
ncbi:hypothetical protein [Roseateles sp.]|uniref:hypothetical protein n=1 Tax=Roseateles sp. TaxID=1971397 RepID=UPI003BA9F84B